MVGLLDPNGPADPGSLYGGLLSPQQSQALSYQGLLAAAGALGQAAMPSRMPIPIGAALGSAAGAMGQAQNETALNAMRGGLLGLQGQELRARLGLMSAAAQPGPPMFANAPGAQGMPGAQPTNGSLPTFTTQGVSAPSGGNPLQSAGDLQRALWQIESGGSLNPKDSSKGAIGPMQIMPATGAQYGANVSALRDPRTNLMVGGAIVNDLSQRYGGDPDAVAVAYNAGPKVADEWLAKGKDSTVLPDETQNYLQKLHMILPQSASTGGALPSVGQGAASPQINPAYIADATQKAHIFATLGIPIPPDIAEAAKFPLVGPTAAAQAAGAYAGPGANPALQEQLARAKALGGIKPFIGGERRGSPIFRYNPQTNNYDLTVQNPQLPEGAVESPNGTISMAPGATQAIQSVESAEAAGKAPYEPPVTLFGPGGVPYSAPRGTPPSAATGGGAQAASPQFASGMPSPGSNAAPRLAQQNMAAAPGAPGSIESVGPRFPVQTAGGAKDISQVTIDDLFPGGQGISQPSAPPAGLGYGEPTTAQKEMQKDSADKVEGFQNEAQGNQKIYLDLAHLRGILQAGYKTGTTAQLAGDIGNLAQSLGVPLPDKFDPTDPAVFNKASTDLVFAAVKKLAGQVRVAEITGYQKANPALAMPPQANMSIINDVLANGKWEDARARLAGQFLATYPTANVSDFIARYNDMAPLTDVRSTYQKAILASGGTIPGFSGSAGGENAAAALPRQTLNGKTYERLGPGQWRLVQ